LYPKYCKHGIPFTNETGEMGSIVVFERAKRDRQIENVVVCGRKRYLILSVSHTKIAVLVFGFPFSIIIIMDSKDQL